MFDKNKDLSTFREFVAYVLHFPTMVILIAIGVLFSGIIFWMFYLMVVSFFSGEIDFYGVLEQVFLIFLYIEVVAAIKIYFSQNYHFPLRFFLYIGITHMIRYIVVSHENGEQILLLSFALLVLVATLALYELKSHYLKQKFKDVAENHFEL